MQTIKDKNYEGQKVLVGVDWNLPLTKEEEPRVTDTTRIERIKETINFLSNQGAKVVLLTHLGRPKGVKKKELSLRAALKPASEILEKEIKFVDDCIGEDVQLAIDKLENGEILLLDNVRFHIEETDYKKKSDDVEVKNFSKKLGSYYDEFVEEAFARCHRKAASTVGILKENSLPCAVGFLVQEEIENLSKLFSRQKDHFYAIIGGAKVSGKVGALNSLIEVANKVFIGGAMAYPFLKALGKEVGQSKISDDDVPLAKEIIDKAEKNGVELLLPIDHLVGDAFSANATFKTTDDDIIPPELMGLDIGPKTIELYKNNLSDAKTIFWNGPMGVFEFEATSKGTFEIAEFIAGLEGVYDVVGGGDSVSALNKSGHAHKISFISTGGGASLEFIEKRGKLPGLTAIGYQGVP